MRHRKVWKWLSVTIPVVVIGFVGFLLYRERAAITSFPWHLHAGYLAAALVAHSAALAVTFVVWHLMIRRLGNFTDWYADLRFYYVSTLAKRIPTSLPYIGSRLYMYRQVNVSAAAVMNCVLLETVLVGIGGVLVLILFVPLTGNRLPPALVPVATLSAVILAATLFARPSIMVGLTNRILRRLAKEELQQTPSSTDLMLWIGAYTWPWLLAGLSFFFAVQGFTDGITLGVRDAVLISTAATLVSLLNLVLPGGLALKEVAITALLSPWMPLSAALVISLAYRLLHTANEILWALLILALPQRSATKAADSPSL